MFCETKAGMGPAELKKRVQSQVWYEGNLWDVTDIKWLNRYDVYIILTRTEADCHPTTTIPITRLVAINPKTTEFYPNTDRVRALVKELNQTPAEFPVIGLKENLTRIWQDLMREV